MYRREIAILHLITTEVVCEPFAGEVLLRYNVHEFALATSFLRNA